MNAVTGVDLEDFMLSDRSQTQKDMCLMAHFYEMSEQANLQRQKVGYGNGGKRKLALTVTSKYDVSMGVLEIFQNQTVVVIA